LDNTVARPRHNQEDAVKMMDQINPRCRV